MKLPTRHLPPDTSLPGYASYAIENLDPELDGDLPESEQLLTLAQNYIDNYNTVVGTDENVSVNAKEAIAQIRTNVTPFYASIWAILPPVIAIVLALITKEVYSSLFIGVLAGGLLYSKFAFEGTLVHVVEEGFVASLADSYNVGILIFLVLLGALVCMMNKAGGSAAFGRWASTHIKSRLGAQICTILLGILIFVDDYFNCLTVGSVMRRLLTQSAFPARSSPISSTQLPLRSALSRRSPRGQPLLPVLLPAAA